MTKKNKNLSGSYTDEKVTIIGNGKPIMRDLNTAPVSSFDVQDAVEKLKRKREKNIAIREEMHRQVLLEHPTIAKIQPYLMVVGAIVAMIIFIIALWIISIAQNSYNANNPMTSFILTKLFTRLMK